MAQDKFLIIATDGLWDSIPNNEAQRISGCWFRDQVATYDDVLSNLFQVNLSHSFTYFRTWFRNPKAFFVVFSMCFPCFSWPRQCQVVRVVAKFQNMLPIALKALTEDRGC